MTNPWGLTKMEIDVIEAASIGLSAKRIAHEFGEPATPHSVDGAIKRARGKLGAKSTVAAAVIWDRFTRDASGQALAQ